MFSKVFLIFIFPIFVSAQIPPDSKPRHDLYKKIKQTTGVSLKEAYEAVFDKNKIASRYRLLQVSNKKQMKKINKGMDDEIARHKKICVKSIDRLDCKKQLKDLEEQKNFISSLDEQIHKNPKLRIYKSLVVLSYLVRHEILKSSYDIWSKDCSSQKKINTIECKKQFFETDTLYAIVRDLAQSSYSKALKENLPINKDELKNLVARYE